MKTDLFQSCGHCWIFQICWHIECNTFTASPSGIWNSSTGIPSPPLALLIVMVPDAHLTSHSKMSGSGEWAHHRGYLGHEDLFCTVLLYILATSYQYLLLLLSFSVLSFCLFALYIEFSKQECWSGLHSSLVDHVLSELSTKNCLSWVALHSMSHSFIELDKAGIQVISLLSFLCLWFPFCLPSEG